MHWPTWATNPFFRHTDVGEKAAPTPDSESGLVANQPPQQVLNDVVTPFKVPSTRLTGHQIFYIFVMDGIGAGAVAGGINFAIAYGMYAHQPQSRPVRLWQFPNTLAGDAGLTVIVQCILTWLVELVMVNYDLKKGGVQPIGFISEPRHPMLRWFMFLDRKEPTTATGGFAHWVTFLLSQILRAFIIAVIFFPFVFGASVGFLSIVGHYRDGDWEYDPKWKPQLFKLIQGISLGVLATPPMVIFWLTRCGWAIQKNEKDYGEK
ncbi:hypothetical protein F4780DRAFT_13911 [Xylariomycetidae sp. FL0641]|nr:hypothetical protein F4780DRAFT_13911 [Xylariomycetidae sp. FL0641]